MRCAARYRPLGSRCVTSLRNAGTTEEGSGRSEMSSPGGGGGGGGGAGGWLLGGEGEGWGGGGGGGGARGVGRS